MQLEEFAQHHVPGLERDEVRHNLILAIIARAVADSSGDIMLWTLGGPGSCAVKTPGRAMVLGELGQEQCVRLAEETVDVAYAGVVGPEPATSWFQARAAALGVAFTESIPQRIYVLHEIPSYPAAGEARVVERGDGALYADWILAFHHEAVPHDPQPAREALEQSAGEGRYLFWIVDGEPVSMAGIVRRTRHVGAIAGVYTPPALRGRGYAGSVTAAVAERIFAEGKSAACLYTDLRNPASNRCYARVGFRPHCDSCFYQRDLSSEPS